MKFPLEQFADDTDFERLALSTLSGVAIDLPKPGAVFDTRSPGPGTTIIMVGLAESGGRSEAVSQMRSELRPLAFAAAYKTLDLMVEYAVLGPRVRQRLSFGKKIRSLSRPVPHLPPLFNRRPALWRRLAALYRTFAEARHAITHRRATQDASGELVIYNDQRVETERISAAESGAFVGAVLLASELVVDRSHDPRRIRLLASHLNSLTGRHRMRRLQEIAEATRRLIQAELIPDSNGQWTLYLTKIKEIVRQQPPGGAWDLELYAGSEIYDARWEDVPDAKEPQIVIQLDPTPRWLRKRR